jgi:hypothetical protein
VGILSWAIGLAVVVIGVSACSAGSHESAGPGASSAALPNAPKPTYGDFVPAGFQLTKVQPVSLDGGATPQQVITATSTVASGEAGGNQERVLILTWDAAANRWASVFDSTPAASSTDPNGPLLSTFGFRDFSVTPVKPAPGNDTDVVISGDAIVPDGVQFVTAIVSYRSNAATYVYTFTDHDAGTTAVLGAPGQQQVNLSANYYTTSDPLCCPARTYHFTVIRKADATAYVVSADDRPWIGAQVNFDTSTLAPSTVTVTGTVAGTPGATKLHAGDTITGVADTDVPDGVGGNGPAVLDEIAQHQPGETIDLDVISVSGVQETVAVTLGSQDRKPLDPASGATDPPGVADI